MTYRKIKAAVYGATAIITAASMGIQTEAARLSEVLPAAGIGLTLGNGSSLANIQERALAAKEEDAQLWLSLAEMRESLIPEEIVVGKYVTKDSMAKEEIVLQTLAMREEEKAPEEETVLAQESTPLPVEATAVSQKTPPTATIEEEIVPTTMTMGNTTSLAESLMSLSVRTPVSAPTSSPENMLEAELSTVSEDENKEKSAGSETEKPEETAPDKKSVSDNNLTAEDAEKAALAEKEIEETQSTTQVVAGQMAALTEEERGFTDLVIAKVTNYVNVRSDAGEEYEVVGKLYDKSVGNFISEKNGWYKITSGNVTGYVKAEFCVTGRDAVDLAKEVGTRVATVATTTLRVREEDSLEASVLGTVPMGEELIVVEEEDEWVKVDIEEGYGWVSKDYVTLRTDFVEAESKEEEEERLAKEAEERRKAQAAASASSEKITSEKKSYNSASSYIPAGGGSASGNAVAQFALQFVGNPYVYGGTSLTNGADCSGFVMSVYKNFGVSLPHSSSADRSVGSSVGSLSEAQPGDLICYSGHVALYIGDGKIVHASTSKTGIIVSNAAYRNILAIRRVF